jgi:glyoxylate/hydroxypyruvate reductase A
MAILCRLNPAHGPELLDRIVAGLPHDEIRVWPDVGNTADVQIAMIHRMPHGFLAGFPNLRLVSAVGAGVDHFTSDPDWPPNVSLVRVTDPTFASGMADYVLLWVLFHQRDMPTLLDAQRRHEWTHMPTRHAQATRVGVLGLGQMGSAVCERLVACGYDVHGWSRNPKDRAGVACYDGEAGFRDLLTRIDILVNLLPLTVETQGLLDARAFARLKTGAVLISAGRAEHIVETDLLAALASGQLRAATLDTATIEPLPKDHPFWTVSNLFITPHCASTAPMRVVAESFVENIRRFRAGEPLKDPVEVRNGY